jgi:hypothetical protein
MSATPEIHDPNDAGAVVIDGAFERTIGRLRPRPRRRP